MKNFKKIVFPLIAALLISGCDSYLTENPTTSLSETAVYSTESGLESLITACYEGMVNYCVYGGYFHEYAECEGLVTRWKGDRSGNSYYTPLQQLTMPATESTFNETTYNKLYTYINRCNSIIVNLPDSPVDQDYKDEIEAEARLVRALFYFFGVRLWSDLPLVTEPPTTVEEAEVPRTSYTEIYAQILEDLEYAETYMRDRERQAEVTGDVGRPNKYAATALKAKVLAQIGTIISTEADQAFNSEADFTECGITSAGDAWTAALEAAEEVINSGAYALESDYRHLFDWLDESTQQSKEAILVARRDDNSDATNYIAARTVPQYWYNSSQNNNWGRLRPSRWFYQKWAEDYADPDQASTYLYTKGYTRSYTGSDGVLYSRTVNNFYLGCPDPRFDATLLHSSYVKKGSYAGEDEGKTLYIYPKMNSSSVYLVRRGDAYDQPYLAKYLNDTTFNVDNTRCGTYVMRFAEVYLIAAESCAELSSSVGGANWQKALDYVEVIHSRARQSTDGETATRPSWADRTFSSKDDLTTAIVWEYIYECYGEGLQSYFDGRRRGTNFFINQFIAPLNAFNQSTSEQMQYSETTANMFKYAYLGKVFDESEADVRNRLLWAFPNGAIDDNTAIGYEDQNTYHIESY